MIAFLRGIVAVKDARGACLDVGGVGYALALSHDALAALPPLGEEAVVLCRMIVSDSGIALYGFSNEQERSLFDALITVSGVGPKTALAALSVFSASQLASAITAQDIQALSKIPGVGKKSASRIALELKDAFPDEGPLFSDERSLTGSSAAFAGIIEALGQMGFTPDEIAHGLEGASEADPESVVLQGALKRLSR